MRSLSFVVLLPALAPLISGCSDLEALTPKTEGSNKPAKLAQKEVREGKIQKVPKE